MRRFVLPSALVVAAALVVWVLVGRGDGGTGSFRFVEIERGDVESVVSSTGILQATTTVEVGTQVSGQISDIYVDFNDHVKKGQLIARIDPTLLQQEVRSAEANLERSRAELEQAQREMERMQRLYKTKVATESEFNTAQYQLAVAEASFKSAQIGLERARRNLGYSEIRAPIDGVVLERTVDVGQTVAASLSAPKLFLIAEDLSEMEILASVDESDIGLIHQGQEARFTVQAYPDEPFVGTVSQVRLQSTIQENVVNYTVVLKVANPDGRLLPGMTATVDFIVARQQDVLKVPNAALRFRPTAAMRSELRARREGEGGGRSARGGREGEAGAAGAAGAGAEGAVAGASHRGAGAGPGADRALLWYVAGDGKVDATPVRTGISDGQYTVVQGPGIEAGMQVIAAVTSQAAAAAVNPFQQQRERRGPPLRM